MNRLFFGDNLNILLEHIKDESVDLIYLDPPFNSKRDYNLHFKEAQIAAFKDTWHWSEQTEAEQRQIQSQPNTYVAGVIDALNKFLGKKDMSAYLTMMARRLLELHRVLKPTGSLYLHCDPTASHYLKIVLDAVFGKENYKNEVIWKRINAKGNVQRKFGAVHDVLFLYPKVRGKESWNQIYRPLDPKYVRDMYRYTESETGRRYSLGSITSPMSRASKGQIYEWRGKRPPPSRCWVYAVDKMERLDREGRIIFSKNGYPAYKRYLDETLGEKLPDVWEDIPQAAGRQLLGYPTQKPLALLERIINASSNPGDVILDPFCGSGTAVHAAEKLGREWIGIDITHLAISLTEKRLRDAFPGIEFNVEGTAKDLGGENQESPFGQAVPRHLQK